MLLQDYALPGEEKIRDGCGSRRVNRPRVCFPLVIFRNEPKHDFCDCDEIQKSESEI
jgi:hypothetical protein